MKLKIIGSICLIFVALVYSCQSDASIEFNRYYSSGNMVYQNHCQNCHGAKGEGLADLIPPLTDTAMLKNYSIALPCIIKTGLKAEIKVSGKSFDGEMPAANLSPIEIAQVVTYVTNSFGNKQGLTNSDQVGVDLGKCGQ